MGHLNKTYNVNVSNYIDDLLVTLNNTKFQHVNMSKVDFSNKVIENFYRKNDVASHLNDEYHAELFLRNIFFFSKVSDFIIFQFKRLFFESD